MRTKIVAGNWKMNKTWDDAKSLLLQINSYVNTHKPNCEVVVAPPYPYLDRASEIFLSHAQIMSQNMSKYESGAYTGEISAEILKSIGVSYSIIGHSERRTLFGETDEIVAKKVETAIKNGIKPFVCCGETLAEREKDEQEYIIKRQLLSVFDKIPESEMKNVVIAYEPVWAIGTGRTASPAQAQEMHFYIRNLVRDTYGQDIAEATRILYGGSVKPGNAQDLFSQPDIDGGLVGGASLDINDFTAIISEASKSE